MKAYERNLLLYDADLRAWKGKGRKNNEPPPEKPEEPSVARYIANDITTEALVELITRKGGIVVPRDLMRSSRRFPTAEAGEAALEELARAGIGRWELDDHAGGRGRPTRRFVLLEGVDVDSNTSVPEDGPR